MTSTKRTRLARITAVGVGLSGLYVAHALLNPAPLPALGVVLAGLSAYALGAAARGLLWSALAGCLLASVAHAYSHVAEARVLSVRDTVGHVLMDALLGLAIGGVILWAAHALASYRRPPGRRGSN